MRASWSTIVVLVGLLTITAVNLAYAQLVEERGLRPLQVQPSAEFDDVVRTARPGVQRWAGIYVEIGAVAEGGELITFPNSRLESGAMRAIAGVEFIVDPDHDPSLDAAVATALRDLPHVEGEFQREERDDRYIVVRPIEPNRADRFRVFLVERALLIVDDHTRSVAGGDG